MKAGNEHLLKFVEDASQFVIPIYQRKYSWGHEECKQLWDDIILEGESEKAGGHFIGSIVYVKGIAHNSPLLVIDGQQRLTTLTLLIVALSEAVNKDEEEPQDGFSQEQLKNYYLVRPYETGEKYRRLVLSETDRDTLFAIIDGRNPLDIDNYSLRIQDNFKFFQERIIEEKIDIKTVWRGLSKLLVVWIALSREEDNAQLVFESMNSKGHVY